MFLYSADFVKRRNYAGEQSWWDLPIDIDNELFEDMRMWDASCRSVWQKVRSPCLLK